jgi:hypothetical protein
MATIRGEGRLRHHFWGDYFATIAIAFKDAASANDALRLFPGFKPGKDPSALVFHGGGEAFETAKAAITKVRVALSDSKRAAMFPIDDPIDSVSRSIDVGPIFEVEVEVAPAEQTSWF